MKKCKEVSESLLASYDQKAKGRRYPKVLSVCGNGMSEGFELSYAAGVLSIKAQSPLAEVYALSLLHAVVPSGHWQECLGLSFPRFPLRPIKLLTSPETEEEAHRMCRRAIGLGYNAIAWEGDRFMAIPSEYGLKAIVADATSALQGDYFFHTWSGDERDENLTVAESALREMKLWEAQLPKSCRLIFYVPYKEGRPPQQAAQLMLMLSLESAPSTCLAFPAVAGEPSQDHLQRHPLWDALRSKPKLLGVEFLPVFNFGGVSQGEGLWPGIAFDQMELLQGGCRRHDFVGALGVTDILPKPGGFLDANLWIMGQLMWRDMPSMALLDTWLRAYKNEQLNGELCRLFVDIRHVILNLSKLRFHAKKPMPKEEMVHLSERLPVYLRGLEIRLAEMEKKRPLKTNHLTVGDYLLPFIRDAKRMLKHYIPSVNLEDDGQESVWTKISLEGAGGRKVLFPERPNQGHPQSRLAMLYEENR